jgi:hypothetical protein
MSAITPESIEQGSAYRELINRPLTPEQARRCVQRLKELATEFKAEPQTSGVEQTHALMLVLGPRKLKGA